MHIHHELRATVNAPADTVWALLGSFGDLSWNPGITAGALVGGGAAQVGSVREMHLLDGSTIRERLEAVGPGRSFTYSFDGPTPIPVSTSRTTVTASPAAAAPNTATLVTWHGEFDVADDDTRQTVEQANLGVVWPALLDGLAAALGVEHTLDTTDHKEGNDRP